MELMELIMIWNFKGRWTQFANSLNHISRRNESFVSLDLLACVSFVKVKARK